MIVVTLGTLYKTDDENSRVLVKIFIVCYLNYKSFWLRLMDRVTLKLYTTQDNFIASVVLL